MDRPGRRSSSSSWPLRHDSETRLGLGLGLGLGLAPSVDMLAEAMTELAWLCDASGALRWGNRAFAESFADDDHRDAFLARWIGAAERQAAGGHQASRRRALVPAWLLDGRAGWFETRAQPLSADGETLTLGLAVEVTVRIDSDIEFARLGASRESHGPQVLALDQALGGMVERIRGMAYGLAPELHRSSDEPILVRCEAILLERALFDVALAYAAWPGADRLVVGLSSRPATGHAVLTLSPCQQAPQQRPPRSENASRPDGAPPLPPMVRALLQASGGAVEPLEALEASEVLEPSEPQKAGLRLLLPLHRTQPTAPRPPAARILVVDDEAVVRMLVVDLLRERGHMVQEAEDAFAAMGIVQAGVRGGAGLDLMITDIGLPGGFDGSTLARRARLLCPNLPILFITGYAFGTNNDVTLEPGIPVLTKPFTLRALSSRIADLLSPDAA